ncbi:MAG: DUF7557 family protein [Candidatus Helarchaeota archaeon]
MTSIHVNEDTWKELNGLKEPGETMDDVIRKLLEIMHSIQENRETAESTEHSSFNELLDEFCTIMDEEFQDTILGTRRSFQNKALRNES